MKQIVNLVLRLSWCHLSWQFWSWREESRREWYIYFVIINVIKYLFVSIFIIKISRVKINFYFYLKMQAPTFIVLYKITGFWKMQITNWVYLLYIKFKGDSDYCYLLRIWSCQIKNTDVFLNFVHLFKCCKCFSKIKLWDPPNLEISRLKVHFKVIRLAKILISTAVCGKIKVLRRTIIRKSNLWFFLKLFLSIETLTIFQVIQYFKCPPSFTPFFWLAPP